MKDLFRELFEYNHWSNEQLIRALTESGNIPDRSLSLVSHVLNAHHIWNYRIAGEAPVWNVWDRQLEESLLSLNASCYRRTLQLLDPVDLEQSVDYRTSKGEPFINNVRDILFHVINHSTHHRAQIAADMKQAGSVPPVMDYIFYKR